MDLISKETIAASAEKGKSPFLDLVKKTLWSTKKRKIVTITFSIWALVIFIALTFLLLNNKKAPIKEIPVSAPVSEPTEVSVPVSFVIAEPTPVPNPGPQPHTPITDMNLSKSCITIDQDFKVFVPASWECGTIGTSTDLAVRGDGIAIEFPVVTTMRQCGQGCQGSFFYTSEKVIHGDTWTGNNTLVINGDVYVDKLFNIRPDYAIAFYESNKTKIYDDEKSLIVKILENMIEAGKMKEITFSLDNSQRAGNIPNADFKVTVPFPYEKTFTAPAQQTLNIRNGGAPNVAVLFDVGYQEYKNFKYDFATQIGTNSQLGEIYKVRALNGIYYVKKEDIKLDGGCDGGSIQSPCGPITLGDYAYYITAAEDTHFTDQIMLSLSYVNK